MVPARHSVHPTALPSLTCRLCASTPPGPPCPFPSIRAVGAGLGTLQGWRLPCNHALGLLGSSPPAGTASLHLLGPLAPGGHLPVSLPLKPPRFPPALTRGPASNLGIGNQSGDVPTLQPRHRGFSMGPRRPRPQCPGPGSGPCLETVLAVRLSTGGAGTPGIWRGEARMLHAPSGARDRAPRQSDSGAPMPVGLRLGNPHCLLPTAGLWARGP